MSRRNTARGAATDPEPQAIVARCLAYAAGRRALGRLFALLEGAGAAAGPQVTVQMANVPTAQISFVPPTGRGPGRGGEFRILLGRRFVAEHARSDADLAFLLAHELLHLIRGDLWGREAAEDAEASNIAADAINDAFLLGPAMGRAFSGVDGLWARRDLKNPVEALLTPLDVAAVRLGFPAVRGWGDAAVRATLFEHARPAGAPSYCPATWADVHATLEERGRAGTIELGEAVPRVKALLAQLPPRSRAACAAHTTPAGEATARDGAATGDRAREAPLVRGAHAALQQAWESDGTTVTPIRVAPSPESRLTRWLRAVANPAGGAGGHDTSREAVAAAGDTGATLGRRAVVEYAVGLRPLPFARVEPSRQPTDGAVTLYLDASESMADALPALVGDLASRGHTWLADPVWVFSTEVVPASLADLRAGRLPSTGGTSFDAVARHILAHRTRRVALVTDGEGDLDPALLQALRDARVVLAVVSPGRRSPSPFDPLVPPSRRWALNLS